MFRKLIEWLKSLFSAPKVGVDKPIEYVHTPPLSKYERLYEVAHKELGVKEIPGSKDTPRIVEYHATTSLKATDDETPWCASFICWCLKQIGEKHAGSAAAKSYDKWGIALNEPIRGCIVCVEHLDFNGKKNGRRHVAIFDRLSSDPRYEYHLGGNQGNAVTIKKVLRQEVNQYRGFRE